MASPRSFAAATIAGLVLLFGAASLMACNDKDSWVSTDDPIGGARSGEAWCVQAVGVDDRYASQAANLIEGHLPEFRELNKVISRDQKFAPDEVARGCPISPAVYRYDCGDRELGEFGCPLRVSEAGRNTLLVFVVPEAETERIFAGFDDRTTAEEMECAGDACAEETVGLYLSPSDLSDSSLLRYWLYEGAGLHCLRPADALRPPQTPPPGERNAPDWC